MLSSFSTMFIPLASEYLFLCSWLKWTDKAVYFHFTHSFCFLSLFKYKSNLYFKVNGRNGPKSSIQWELLDSLKSIRDGLDRCLIKIIYCVSHAQVYNRTHLYISIGQFDQTCKFKPFRGAAGDIVMLTMSQFLDGCRKPCLLPFLLGNVAN